MHERWKVFRFFFLPFLRNYSENFPEYRDISKKIYKGYTHVCGCRLIFTKLRRDRNFEYPSNDTGLRIK